MTLRHDSASEPDDATAADVTDAILYADRQLRLTYRPRPGAALIQLIGEVDSTNRPALAETLTRAGHDGDLLLIDLRHLCFVDAGGMRLLAQLCQAGTARVVNVPPYLRRLAELLDLPLCDGAPVVPTAAPIDAPDAG
ncbi:STAS domain-containing protein [Planobispora takensis]|uniref:STAS domain-containing protein n=1 Tax=Planobispora takensis TaxID=1367882 RepID=A0A8J3T1A7_9ACTN|nr:STAS domain-containing protein [Planobispora takensis]GII04499.1 hypothetical protein Pta02_65070 [Planobispora takensis]